MLACGLCGEWWVGEGYMCSHVDCVVSGGWVRGTCAHMWVVW